MRIHEKHSKSHSRNQKQSKNNITHAREYKTKAVLPTPLPNSTSASGEKTFVFSNSMMALRTCAGILHISLLSEDCVCGEGSELARERERQRERERERGSAERHRERGYLSLYDGTPTFEFLNVNLLQHLWKFPGNLGNSTGLCEYWVVCEQISR